MNGCTLKRRLDSRTHQTIECPTHSVAIACWNATRLEVFALVRNDPSSPTTITGLAPLGALHFPSPPAAVTLVGSGDVRAPQLEGRQYKEAMSAVLEAGVVAAVFVAVDTRVGSGGFNVAHR